MRPPFAFTFAKYPPRGAPSEPCAPFARRGETKGLRRQGANSTTADDTRLPAWSLFAGLIAMAGLPIYITRPVLRRPIAPRLAQWA